MISAPLSDSSRIAFQPINLSSERINADQSSFATLPIDLKLTILKLLDLRSLAMLSSTTVQWNNFVVHDQIWIPIALRVNCFVQQGDPIYKQVITYMTDLLTRGGRIIKVIRGPTIEQFNMLQEWLKARDTLIIWRTLAKLTTYQFHVFLDYPEKSLLGKPNETIEKAKQFKPWVIKHSSSLNRLTMFCEADHRLTSLPSELCLLTQLATIYLVNEQLIALPKETSNFANLRELMLSNCEFTVFPIEICDIPKLEDLMICESKLLSLPTKIDQLTRLKRFNCNSNQLASLPLELFNLTRLESLQLANNQLSSLPPQCGRLTALTGLCLNHNKFTVLPNEMRNLVLLEGLRVGNNPFSNQFLKALPHEIATCIEQNSCLKKDQITLFLQAIDRKQ